MLVKLWLVIFDLLVINILINFQTNKASKKKFTCIILLIFPLGCLPYNLWNIVCNSVGIFNFPSVNITNHRWNIIYNFVGKLTVAMILAVIFFQLSEIYWRKCSVSNPANNNLKYVFKKYILNRSRKIIKIKYIKWN